MVIFFKKLRKLPSDWGIYPVQNTFELHQFAQHAVYLNTFFEQDNFNFWFKPLSKILVAAVRLYLIQEIMDTSPPYPFAEPISAGASALGSGSPKLCQNIFLLNIY